MVTIYGIANCDKCRSALTWFKERDVPITFHDVRKEGFPSAEFQVWQRSHGLESLVNKRSTTWRAMDTNTRAELNDSNAAAMLAANPTLMKRPVVVSGQAVVIGYDEALWTALPDLKP